MNISFLIPVYNTSSELLNKCLASVLACRTDGDEIVVIDDGSTDKDTISTINDLAKKHSEIFLYRQQNKGLFTTRDILLQLACEKYVCFVDSDDELEPDPFRKIRHSIQTDFDIICFDMISIETCGTKLPVNPLFGFKEPAEININDYYRRFFTSDALNSMCGKIYRKNLLTDTRPLPSRIVLGEDRFRNLATLAKISRVIYFPEISYKYIQEPNSMVHKPNRSFIQDILFYGDQDLKEMRRLGYPVTEKEYFTLYGCSKLFQAILMSYSLSDSKRRFKEIRKNVIKEPLWEKCNELKAWKRQPVRRRIFVSFFSVGLYFIPCFLAKTY